MIFIFNLNTHTHTHTHSHKPLESSPTLFSNKHPCVDRDQIDTYDGKSNILTEWPLDAANSENKKSMLNNHIATKCSLS